MGPLYLGKKGTFVNFRYINNLAFGVLVGGGNLMTSYLDKHFKPVPVCCGYFKRHTSKHLPNNKQVKWRAVRKEMNKKKI